jgi:dCMP deaminase
MLDKVGDRVTCTRGKCAAIFTVDNAIVSTGYAGAPPGLSHCTDVGDQLEERVQFLDEKTISLNDGSLVFSNTDTVTFNGVTYRWNHQNQRFETEKKIHCIRTIHGEQNAICNAAKRGVCLNNSTLYVSMTPCRNCAMLIISVGTKRVVCQKRYHAGKETEYMFSQVGIELIHLDDEIVKYSNQTKG